MDPSLGTYQFIKSITAEGFQLIYEREVPFELRINDGENGP